MTRLPPRPTRTDTLLPYTTLCRSYPAGRIVVRKRLLLIGMLVLAGCGNSPSSGGDAIQDVNILALESRIETIERGMEALKKSPTPSLEMKPSDNGWSWLKGDGTTIWIGMEKLDDNGNGSRLGFASGRAHV